MPYRVPVVLSAAALSLLVLAACSDSTNPDHQASVRVANASPTASGGLTAMDDDDNLLASGLNFQNTNAPASCSAVKNGTPEVAFSATSPSTGLGSLSFPAWPEQNYTIVFFGNNSAISLVDLFVVPAPANNALRIVNGTATAGDIYVTTPTATIVAPPTISNLAAGQVSGFDANSAPGGVFIHYTTAQTRVRMFNVGQTTNPRADFLVTGLPSNRVATVVLTPPPTGASTTGFLVPTCAN